MKANELRIGNYVYLAFDELELSTIKCIDYSGETSDYKYYIKNQYDDILSSHFLRPIPLTEEWLIKFGFDGAKCKYVNIDESFEQIQVLLDGGDVLAYDKNLDFIVLTSNIKYVHQLQNLYFALTGEEL